MAARQVDSFTVPDSEWPWQPQQIEEFAAAAAAKPNPDLNDNIKFPSPWNTSVGNMYIIKLHPLTTPPVPPIDYDIYNQSEQWTLQANSPGYIIVVQITESPMGRYNEVVYVPGRYRPNSCKRKGYPSVQRMWLDSNDSISSGRPNWGYPKQYATFKWSNSSTTEESVEVRDALNRLIIKATFTRSSIFPTWFTRPRTQSDLNAAQMQWPLTKKDLANPTQAEPVLIPTVFYPSSFYAVDVSNLFINHFLFTGIRGLNVRRVKAVPVVLYQDGGGLIPVGVKLPKNC
eukprot:gene8749-8929_t